MIEILIILLTMVHDIGRSDVCILNENGYRRNLNDAHFIFNLFRGGVTMTSDWMVPPALVALTHLRYTI